MKSKKSWKLINNDYTLNMFSKVLTILIGVISSAFSVRFLGVVNKGVYTYITQISGIGVILCNLGVYQSYSYNFKIYGKQALKKYSDIFSFQFIVLAVMSGIICLISNDLSIVMVALLIPFNLIKTQYENIVMVENMRLRMSVYVFDQLLIAVCYAVLCFTAESNVLYVVLVTLLVDVFTVLVFIRKLHYIPKMWQIDWDLFGKTLRFGFLPMLSLLLSRVNYSIDIFFLRNMSSPEQLGQYSFAATVTEYVWMLPDAFKEVLLSKSARKFDRKNISLAVKISMAVMLVCLIGFTLFGKWLISFVYGSEYLPAYGILILLILGSFPMVIFKLLGNVLISQGKRGMHFTALAVSAVVNIIANLYAVPVYGMYGAAWASVISYTICGLFLTVYFCRLYSFSLRELMLPTKADIAGLKKLVSKK